MTNDRSWSSAKLFIMQNYTLITLMGGVPLSAENVWNFLFPLRWWCAHVLLERGMKHLYNPHLHYMLKASDKNIRIRFKICSKLTQKTTEWYHWRRSGALLVNFKHFTLSSIVSIADIEHLMRAGIVKVFFTIVIK